MQTLIGITLISTPQISNNLSRQYIINSKKPSKSLTGSLKFIEDRKLPSGKYVSIAKIMLNYGVISKKVALEQFAKEIATNKSLQRLVLPKSAQVFDTSRTVRTNTRISSTYVYYDYYDDFYDDYYLYDTYDSDYYDYFNSYSGYDYYYGTGDISLLDIVIGDVILTELVSDIDDSGVYTGSDIGTTDDTTVYGNDGGDSTVYSQDTSSDFSGSSGDSISSSYDSGSSSYDSGSSSDSGSSDSSW